MKRKEHQFIQKLQEKEKIASTFLIKNSILQNGKNGKPFLSLILMDQTGEIEARIWDGVAQYVSHAIQDHVVYLEGKCQVYQGRKQIVINHLQLQRDDEIDLQDYLMPSPNDPEVLYEKLIRFIDSMQDPHYRALAEVIFIEDQNIQMLLKRAPAAKSIHHAYPTGLLEHIVSILGLLHQVSQHYGALLNRDLLLMGGLLHDLGKLWELSYEKVTDYTDIGKLVGHLVIGVELIEKKIRELEEVSERFSPGQFPEHKRLLLKHLILSHHGKLEFGSPKLPQCLEAIVIHAIDDLDSKLNTISRFISQDQNLGSWTLFHKGFERSFFKGVSD